MITTYLTDQDEARFSKVEDPELNKLLQEIRAVDPCYLVDTQTVTSRSLFGKRKTTVWYTLYIKLAHEIQVYNFPPVIEGQSSINTSVSKGQLMTYFYALQNAWGDRNPAPVRSSFVPTGYLKGQIVERRLSPYQFDGRKLDAITIKADLLNRTNFEDLVVWLRIHRHCFIK